MAQATQIKQQSAQLEAQSAQIKQQRTQLEAQSAQIETLQSDLAKKREGSDLSSQAAGSIRNILQQVQQSLERGSAVRSASLRPRLSRPWKRQSGQASRQTLPFLDLENQLRIAGKDGWRRESGITAAKHDSLEGLPQKPDFETKEKRGGGTADVF